MEQLRNWLVSIDKSYFEHAQITLEPIPYEGNSIVSNIYLMFLHKVCLFFGNVYDACLIAHFITFILAVFVWYFVFRKLFKGVIASVLTSLCVFVPLGILLAVTLNPFVLWILFFGIVLLVILSCIKGLLGENTKESIVLSLEAEQTECESFAEPVVTIVNFDDEKAVTVSKNEEERPAIFIPKDMKIPKRVSKPKIDYSEAVAADAMFYDMDVADLDDFDLPNPF